MAGSRRRRRRHLRRRPCLLALPARRPRRRPHVARHARHRTRALHSRGIADPAGGCRASSPSVLAGSAATRAGAASGRPRSSTSAASCAWPTPQIGTPPATRAPRLSPGPPTGTPPTRTGASAGRGPRTGTGPMPPRSPSARPAEGQPGRLSRDHDHRPLRKHADTRIGPLVAALTVLTGGVIRQRHASRRSSTPAFICAPASRSPPSPYASSRSSPPALGCSAHCGPG